MGHAFQSDLRRWDIVSGLCQSIDARTYVEVGCKAGDTVGHVLRECPQIRAIAIDPWCEQAKSDDPTRESYESWDFRKIEAEFWKNVGENKDRCFMIRAESKDARDHPVPRPLPYVDVIFIDALHDYESVKQDIAIWWPLVREGGYLVLHDYNHKWPGVMRAVAETFNLMDVCCGPDSTAWVQKPEGLTLKHIQDVRDAADRAPKLQHGELLFVRHDGVEVRIGIENTEATP